MDTKDWNTGYAAGYKAGLQRAVAVCKEIRNDYNKHAAGKGAYTCRRHGHGLCVRDRRPDPFIGSA
jgi:hypothetical protein